MILDPVESLKQVAATTIAVCCLVRQGSTWAVDVSPHPLLPSVRSPDVRNPGWCSAFHDRQLTGFSPLRCGMKQAPSVWSTIQLGGRAKSAVFVEAPGQQPFLLLEDSRLRRVDVAGEVVWELTDGSVCFYEQLHSDDRYSLGVLQGNTLLLVDPDSGRPFWRKSFEVPSSDVAKAGTLSVDRIRTAAMLPDYPGKQIVVFPGYVVGGYLFGFPADQREPVQVWRTEEGGVLHWPPAADHGVMTLIEPSGAAIWNIRHHTLNRHDPKTGRLLQRFQFSTGGGQRRNYGPSLLGNSADGKPLIIATSHAVQYHLNVFTRPLDGPPTQLLDRYFGEPLFEPGASCSFPVSGLGDADGDGGLDVVYSARTADPGARVRTVICDAGSGRERTLNDVWLVGLVDLDGDGRKELLAYQDPKAEMPAWGTLQIYRFESAGEIKLLGSCSETKLILRPLTGVEQPSWAAWGQGCAETPAVLELSGGQRAVFVRDCRTRSVRQLTIRDGQLAAEAAPKPLDESEILAIGRLAREQSPSFVLQQMDGKAAVVGLDGRVRFELQLCGGPNFPRVAAADLSGSGRCELAVYTPTDLLQIVSLEKDGRPRFGWSTPLAPPPLYPLHADLPLRLHDLNGDGRTEVVTISKAPDGALSVQLLNGQGEKIWETPLPLPTPGRPQNDSYLLAGRTRCIVGDFFGRGRAGVFVPPHMLDGPSGRIVWSGRTQATSDGQTRECIPRSTPAAVDVDGDGADDLVLDYLDFAAILRGSDGEFLLSLRAMPSVPAGWRMAYNSFIPLYRPADSVLHFLVPSGHGGIGLLGADLTTEVWTHKPFYDTPARLAMIDVDGNGRPEVGYEEARDGWFVCRDLWSGAEQWRLKLDGRGFGPAISADVDGDEKGEFLIGGDRLLYCIGTDPQAQGVIRWRLELPASIGCPSIADVDGNGQGEIILPCSDGAIRVLKGH